MVGTQEKEWFESWFATPYYQILYQNRDYQEAQLFVDTLLRKIQLPQTAHVLDLACGNGRHSIYLNKKGFQVTGSDLSAYHIQEAKKHENAALHFVEKDMREIIALNAFDAVFNLFTSFGYFNNIGENQTVIDAVFAQLKQGGCFVLDYMNSEMVINNLVEEEVKVLNEIDFFIQRRVEDNKIHKTIRFTDPKINQDFEYIEKVQAFKPNEILNCLKNSGFSNIELFGDYTLEAFDVARSPRQIWIAYKK
jgi:SAM-dependent methyltransferase